MKKLSKKEMAILAVLRDAGKQGMFGLELVKAGIGLKRGTIYVTLASMRARDLVRSEEVGHGHDLPRPRFFITQTGLRAMAGVEVEHYFRHQKEAT